MNRFIKIRSRILFSFFFLGFFLIGYRLVLLQWVERDLLVGKRVEAGIEEGVYLSFRGRILDSSGEVLAQSIRTYSVGVFPRRMGERKWGEFCKVLWENPDLRSFLSSLPFSTLGGCIRIGREEPFFYLWKGISFQEKEQILTSLSSFRPYLSLELSSKRIYPKGTVAGPILGFVGLQGYGLEGVEKGWDSFLTPRWVTGEEEEKEGVIVLDPKTFQYWKLKSQDLVLSLDSGLQGEVESLLLSAQQAVTAERALAIFAEIPSGKIRVAAQVPLMDPNGFYNYPSQNWRFFGATDLIEPGSAIKPFLYYGALKNGFTPLDLFYGENGAYFFSGHWIRDVKPSGWIPLREMVIRSSNIVAAKLALSLGKEKVYDLYRFFGFGEKVSLGLPYEPSGILRPPSRLYPLDLASMGFGQGIGVTPLQLLRAYLRLVMGGVPAELTLLENSPSFYAPRKDPLREELIRTLAEVVERGSGSKAKIPILTIGGKTGTAQKGDPLRGGYLPDARISLFAGFFPVENPRFVGLVLLDNPKVHTFGGESAAPLFREIAMRIAVRYGLFSTQDRKEKFFPQEEEKGKVTFSLDFVPDLRGLSLREAGSILSSLGISLLPSGVGRVVEQFPPPGSPFPSKKIVRVVLREEM